MAYTFDIVRLHGLDENNEVSASRVSASGHFPIMQYGHMSVHQDRMCVASYYDSAVATTAPLMVHVKASTGYEIHSHFSVAASGGVKAELYEHESTAITSSGTAMTVCRFNRGSTVGDSDRTFTFYDAVESSAGTLLMTAHNGGTTSPTPNSNPIGGAVSAGEEFIFPANTSKSYIVKLTPDADNTKLTFIHEYYEV